MMTEEQFYKEKIFNKVRINQLKRQFPESANAINLWYKSDRYNCIQYNKLFLASKLKQMTEDGREIKLDEKHLYLLHQWWEHTPKICYYCSLPEAMLDELHRQPEHINKRYPQRGKSLEIDRQQADLPYHNIDNLVLACYWCNNAKTDTFTAVEFRHVGEVFKTIWEQRLNRSL